MPEKRLSSAQDKFDFRVYIGILVFRWQIIAVCFLYCLLGGVLYLNLVPKQYIVECKMFPYRDPRLSTPGSQSPWGSLSTHRYLLTSRILHERVVDRLYAAWGGEMGGRKKMLLPVTCRQESGLGGMMLIVSVMTGAPAYGVAFLQALTEEHQAEWQSVQMESSTSATKLLEEELSRMEGKIREAEDNLIEYQRLNDIARVEAKGSMESAYLQALMGRHNQLATEIMMLEAQYPALKGQSPGVIGHVDQMTRETAAVEPAEEAPEPVEQKAGTAGEKTAQPAPPLPKPKLPPELTAGADTRGRRADDGAGWQDLRIRLERLREKEKELAVNMTPENPQRKALRSEMEKLQSSLDSAAQLQLSEWQDRYKALQIQLNAIESAEYKWQAKNLLASQRQADLNRIASEVKRFEANYDTLYGSLHNMRIAEELKVERVRIVEPVSAGAEPVWPDPLKVLLAALVFGLGSGVGLALLAQMFDNKIQTIKDVEQELGVPFLGGIPFWIHSGLERTIRPIVTEEHATGAVEAYRALRTVVIASLARMNEKIVFVTSADSREGKTLTTLNMAIVISQMKKKVLLIDMDLRRGRLHRSLGLNREPGVTDVLKSGGSLKDVIVPTRIENLYLAPTGSTIPDAAELLQSRDVVGMFVDIQDDYDYIFVDTSPVLRVTDTVILATQGIGVVLYVARVNHTPKPLIRYSLDMFSNARVLGLIMNSIEMHRLSSLYYSYQYPNYAYYSNAYAYGYNYYHYGDRDVKEGGARARPLAARWQAVVDWARRTFLPF